MKKRPKLHHYTIEIFNIDRKILLKYSDIKPYAEKFIKKNNLIIFRKEYYNFSPWGTTLLFILSSSSLVFHTWPEFNYLHIDVLICSQKNNIKKTLKKSLKEIFKSNNFVIKKISYDS